MGKPRMIIVVRHAQSEGNMNRDIHQFTPDHRVKLTSNGWQQAEDAGRRLRSLLRPDDTLQFFTSPYRRTRETTEGILSSLTADSDEEKSPFRREDIKVFEEPRLREQDFGNFQPCSAEMERMWQERADYGHFFYRIPNGESAADAYDRIAGFNETLWRFFGEEDFPSVCVLVTHGLMTRVFLMKWYHWSVEHFEDLRNIDHCEFITMERKEKGPYVLQNQLRTWSELRKRAGLATHGNKLSTNVGPPAPGEGASPTTPIRRWGGCVNGCNHAQMKFPKRVKRQHTADLAAIAALDKARESARQQANGKKSRERGHHDDDDNDDEEVHEQHNHSKDPLSATSTDTPNGVASSHPFRSPLPSASMSQSDSQHFATDPPTSDPSSDMNNQRKPDSLLAPTTPESPPANAAASQMRLHLHYHRHRHSHSHNHDRDSTYLLLSPGRDFGGSLSGANTPTASSGSSSCSDENERDGHDEVDGKRPKSKEQQTKPEAGDLERESDGVATRPGLSSDEARRRTEDGYGSESFEDLRKEEGSVRESVF